MFMEGVDLDINIGHLEAARWTKIFNWILRANKFYLTRITKGFTRFGPYERVLRSNGEGQKFLIRMGNNYGYGQSSDKRIWTRLG